MDSRGQIILQTLLNIAINWILLTRWELGVGKQYRKQKTCH